jgi:hypothetical protein
LQSFVSVTGALGWLCVRPGLSGIVAGHRPPSSHAMLSRGFA